MPIAPKRRSGRLPHFSTRYKPGTVEQTFTTLFDVSQNTTSFLQRAHSVITEIINGFLMPLRWKYDVP